LDKANGISRRALLKSAALGGLALHADAGEANRAGNKVEAENAKPGTTDWQLTYTRVTPESRYRCPWIEGYVSHASIKAGEDLRIMVSTNPPAPFTVDIYRMGYYNGAGARHITSLGPLQGKTQAEPPVGEERLRECAWETSAVLPITEDFPSGIYLGKLSLLEDRYQSYVIFIVREERNADLLLQCSDNTWQAYNRWPDNFALYNDGKSEWALKPGIKVSYERPYGKYCQILDAPLSQGSGEFLLWEFPLVFWLEQHGYDVTYCSNTDVHADAGLLSRAKAFISVGHDEYWSLEQFAHVKDAVEAGLNVAFLSGNTACFVAPFSPSGAGTPNRVITRAGRYGGLMEAEKEMMGPFAMEGPNEATLIGARTISPYNGSGDWIVADAGHWLFEETGVANGDGIPGLVGWEFHGDPAPIPGLKVLAEGETTNASGQNAHWTATIYPGPKGNWVFNASTIWWAQGLSTPPGHILPYSHYGRPHGPDERVQRITQNLLRRMIGVDSR